MGTGRQLRGSLRLSAPSDFGRATVRSWLDAFLKEHPDVAITLLLSDQMADFYRERVDLAVRYGVLEDSSLIVRPLVASHRRVLCAAPGYVKRRGRPARP